VRRNANGGTVEGMSSLVESIAARQPLRDPTAALLRLIGIASLSFVVGRFAIGSNAAVVAAAAALIVFLVSVALLAPLSMLYGALVWLVALGFLRRVAYDFGFTYYHDPLLLIGPAAVGMLVLVAARRGAFSELTALSGTVLALNLLFLAGALNPLQGSPLVGAAGLLFTLIPTLGFWIGRGLLDTRVFSTIVKLTLGLALVVAGYGFYQIFHGFPSWDLSWIQRSNYNALYVFATNQVGTYRPFGTLASAQEFVLLLAIGVVACISYLLCRRGHRAFLLAAFAFLVVGVVYGSSRSAVVTLGAAVALTLAARRALSLPLAATLGAGLLVLLPVAISPLLPAVSNGSPLLAHQIQGLANPLNPQASTLRSHLSLFETGIRSAVSHPLGRGPGSVTLAADRFGSLQGGQTEADPSNAAVALGIPGLLLFVALFALAFRCVYSVAVARSDPVSLAALGILTVTSLQWLNGGLYAVSLITWIALGWSDRAFTRLRTASVPQRSP
jgi:hypothetical protein